jgi:prepilin peptidase CpaA
MDFVQTLGNSLASNWPVWFVSVVLVVAAVIDGMQLRVPNWLTFPLVISGWIYSAAAGFVGDGLWGLGAGLLWSLLGTAVGLALLLPAYSIGGMGAGDVKLLAGVGAWLHSETTFYAFCVATIVGGVLAIAMAAWRRGLKKHALQAQMILNEILIIRDPAALSEIAAERKSSMLLLPYGIPIAIGAIVYFAWAGKLVG